MTTFAPGTTEAQMREHYSRMPRSLGGVIPDAQHAYGLPQAPSRQPSQPRPFDAQRHFATGGKMSNGKPMAVYGPSAPMGGMAPQPQGMYAAGTSPEYMAANPDTLPYRPGAAQPKQPPSQGSPYAGTRPIDDGLLPAGSAGGPAWSQGKASPPSGQYAGRYMAGVTPEYMAANPDALPPPSPQARPQGPKQTFQMGGGNLAYAAPDKRPPPFTQSASFGGMSGPAQDMFDTRAAFVQSVNNARAPHAAQWGQGAFAPPPSNFGQMMGQAQDMVKSGWQNSLQGLFGGDGSPSGRLRKGATAASAGPPPPGFTY